MRFFKLKPNHAQALLFLHDIYRRHGRLQWSEEIIEGSESV